MQRTLNRDERGVSAIIVGLLATTLISTVGLSVDVGNLVLERGKMQQGADNAALAIAQDCALRRTSCNTSGTNPALGTANLLVGQNVDGTTVTVPGTVTSSTKTVTVKATKSIPLTFASLIGIGPKTATVSASASWEEAPREGYPLLPMAIGYCQYLANAAPKDDHILVRTDILSSALTSVGAILGLIGLQTYFPNRTCTSRTGQNLSMSDGAVWLTSLPDALDLFDVSNMSQCNMKVTIFTTAIVTTVTPVIAPTACVNKLKLNTVAMMPIYESTSPLTILSTSITMKVVGFAPFMITGWKEPGNAKNDSEASPSCLNILTITCQGIQGYFVRSVVQDPDQIFAYDSTAPDLGGVRLTPKLTN
jgi:hypothetical protein